MAEITTEDVVLHVEVDWDGQPTTLLAHGLTNSCRGLAQLTPLLPGRERLLRRALDVCVDPGPRRSGSGLRAGMSGGPA